MTDTPCHPQILIDADGATADEKIAPLVAMVLRAGLVLSASCQGGDPVMAHLIFPDPADALEFLSRSGHYADYTLGDNLALTLTPPTQEGTPPAGKVSWLPQATDYLINAWRVGA